MKPKNPTKDLYQQLRRSTCEQLWTEEVPAFDAADARGRMDRVAVVRAVGVVFSESGSEDEKEQARQWLLGLLNDPEEKIRRYAMAALPKLGASQREETALHSLLGNPASERETKFLAKALEKIGGSATLKHELAGRLPESSLQKLEANRLRSEQPGGMRMEALLSDYEGLQIRLDCRAGLEDLVEDELRDAQKFRVVQKRPGSVILAPKAAFSLADVYKYRCFAEAGFLLGTTERNEVDSLAAIIASPLAQRIFGAFTDGPIRYRLEFTAKGHQRGFIRQLAARVYELDPRLLNDARSAPWQIDIHEFPRGVSVVLSPRLRPDPRFAYRVQDVPAASHPPLAACLVRLAGSPQRDEIAWDPFCGSGLELIERSRAGGIRGVIGTDTSEEAIRIAEANFAAGGKGNVASRFVCCDFRDYKSIDALKGVSLIITNPPLGRRVPIPNLGKLIGDLFKLAEELLQPGGRIVLVNPLSVKPRSAGMLRQEYRRKIDLGGFHCHLEKYVKATAAERRAGWQQGRD